MGRDQNFLGLYVISALKVCLKGFWRNGKTGRTFITNRPYQGKSPRMLFEHGVDLTVERTLWKMRLWTCNVIRVSFKNCMGSIYIACWMISPYYISWYHHIVIYTIGLYNPINKTDSLRHPPIFQILQGSRRHLRLQRVDKTWCAQRCLGFFKWVSNYKIWSHSHSRWSASDLRRIHAVPFWWTFWIEGV